MRVWRGARWARRYGFRFKLDRRIFTPVARSSYRWLDYYDQRSAVERVNSRLAGPFRFVQG